MSDLEALSGEIAAISDAVRLAIAAVKANPPHPESPMPWYGCQFTGVLRDGDSNELADSLTVNDSLHIAAAVNAAPVLIAEVERLQAVVEAARVAVAEMRQDHRSDCARIILGQWGRECDCGWAEILVARRALGLE